MITRLRLIVVLARPAVVLLLFMFTAIGVAQAGRADDALLLGTALLSVAGYLVFSVALNDLADERIDQVNLAGDRRRPLVIGAADRSDMINISAAAGSVALLASLTLNWQAALVMAAGMLLSASYSLPPLRWASRGALASLLLPACYVAVPYMVGIFAVRPTLRAQDALILLGLYIGFIGRIVLKDFRDVRGDELFGKRTFLIRHGRGPTCLMSAVGITLGSVLLAAALPQPSLGLLISTAASVLATVAMLRLLALDLGPRRDETLISVIAILGRGIMLVLLLEVSARGAGWVAPARTLVIAALTVVTFGQAWAMYRTGPLSRLTVPDTLNFEGALPAAEHAVGTSQHRDHLWLAGTATASTSCPSHP